MCGVPLSQDMSALLPSIAVASKDILLRRSDDLPSLGINGRSSSSRLSYADVAAAAKNDVTLIKVRYRYCGADSLLIFPVRSSNLLIRLTSWIQSILCCS